MDETPTSPWLTTLLGRVRTGAPAFELLTGSTEPAIAQHVVRTLRYAVTIGEREGVPCDLDALVPACLLHDIGATGLATGAERFEVQGADIAVGFLERQGEPADRQTAVWRAIALHTSPHVAERIDPLTRLVRLGVRTDFGADLVDPRLREQTEREHPRRDVERVLSGVVVDQAEQDERRAPRLSWAAALLRAHREEPGPDARLAGF